jgi:hypothetical protein
MILCEHRLADLTDLNIIMENLDSTLFPGISQSVKVHAGFANEQAKYVYLQKHNFP